MNNSGFIHIVYKLSIWVTRLVFVNLIWLLFNLLIAFLLFNVFLATDYDDLLVNMISIFALAPFLFFPSTTALFGVVRKWIISEDGFPVFRSFFLLFKENYRRSLTGGLVIVPLWMILAIDYLYFSNENSPLYYLFLALVMFIFAFSLYFFSNTVHFHLNFKNSLKNSLLLALGNPVLTIILTLVNGLIIFISIKFLNLLLFLGTGSLIAYISFYAFYRGQLKIQGENNNIESK